MAEDLVAQLLAAQRQENDLLTQLLAAERGQAGPFLPDGSPNPAYVETDAYDQATRGVDWTALGHGAANGATLGFADNILGGMAVVTGRSPDGSRFGDYSDPGASYAAMRDAARADLAADRERAPGYALTGELAGGVATSLAAAPSTMGRGLAGLRRAMGFGAGEGAAALAGNSDAETWGGLARAAAVGGTVGAALGAAAPAVVAVGRAAIDPLVGAYKAMRGTPYEGRAARALYSVFRRSGMSPADASRAIQQAAAEGQDVFMTADALGTAGQRALAGVARQPGVGREEIAAYLAQRQIDQGDRVAGFVQDGLGVSRTAQAEEGVLRAERRAITAPLYQAAEQQAAPVNLSGVSLTLDRALRIDPVIGASSLSQTEMGRRLAALRGQIANGREMLTDFNSVLQVRSDLGRFIAENPNLPPIYGQLNQQLDAALEQASAGYRAANGAYRDRSLSLDALQMGREAAGPARVDDSLAAFRALPQAAQGPTMPGLVPDPAGPGPRVVSAPGTARPNDPRQAFRTGYADVRLGTIERATPGRNAALPFTTSRDRALMDEIAQDPARFRRQIDREMTMAETRQAALGGSKTADNLADQADMNGVGQGIGVLSNILAGRYGTAGADLMRQIASAGTGLNEETRTLIGRALLSRDPQQALASLMRRAARDGEQQRAVEAFLRHLGYSGVQSLASQ